MVFFIFLEDLFILQRGPLHSYKVLCLVSFRKFLWDEEVEDRESFTIGVCIGAFFHYTNGNHTA